MCDWVAGALEEQIASEREESVPGIWDWETDCRTVRTTQACLHAGWNKCRDMQHLCTTDWRHGAEACGGVTIMKKQRQIDARDHKASKTAIPRRCEGRSIDASGGLPVCKPPRVVVIIDKSPNNLDCRTQSSKGKAGSTLGEDQPLARFVSREGKGTGSGSGNWQGCLESQRWQRWAPTTVH